MQNQLGKLGAIDVREQWNDEAADFTPWLASEEGLSLLSETLDMELELEDTEVPVGPYSADVVAIDSSSNARVVVENQLAKTDHDHLGKTITYASGLGATVIIWIAKSFTDEHRRAFDYLNENAAPGLRFFGLEIQLWKIGDSLPAPMFKVVSSPNDYLVSVKAEEKELSDTQVLYQTFWTAFKDHCQQKGSTLKLRKPLAQHWMSLAVGRTNFNVSLTASKQKGRIGCELYIHGPTAKRALQLLQEQKEKVEQLTGPLDWQDIEGSNDCRIVLYREGIDVAAKEKWEDAFTWLRAKGEQFCQVFAPRVQALVLENDQEQE